ncbi:MAG: hypothetical protein GF355_04560 [Candidatus Eisenbacteria bacterium]|nr:hypothetical protein [Candidatus Eisenbacteria bacterium]
MSPPMNRPARISPERRPGARWRLRILGLGFLLVALLVQNLTAWWTYHEVRRTLDQQLGERLVGVAAATAAGLPAEWVRSLAEKGLDSPYRERCRSLLEEIVRETLVGNVFLFDTEKRNLYDWRERFPIGFVNPLLDLHYAEVTVALAGVPAATPLYQEGDVYLKSGFAPVRDGVEVAGVVGVEGSAAFFQVLADLRQTFLWAGGLGLASMLVLGFLFLRILRGLGRAEATVAQTSALAVAGELAAMVAHEIRNPLSVIRSRAERVRAKLERDAPREEILEGFAVIPREVDRLNQILSGYLAFARPSHPRESGGLVSAALQTAADLMENECRRKGIALRVQSEVPEAVQVRAPTHDLQQILVNLLLNAVQALEQDGGTIEVAGIRSGSRVSVTVSDSGAGVPPDQREAVFDPFFTTKTSGSGLGLAIVKMLVERHGGRVRAERSRLGGASFRVELPVEGESGGAGEPARSS